MASCGLQRGAPFLSLVLLVVCLSAQLIDAGRILAGSIEKKVSLKSIDRRNLASLDKGMAEVAKFKAWMVKQKNLAKLHAQFQISGNAPAFYDYLKVIFTSGNVGMLLPTDAAWAKVPAAAKKKMLGDVKSFGDLMRAHIINPRYTASYIASTKIGATFFTLQGPLLFHTGGNARNNFRLGPNMKPNTLTAQVVTPDAYSGASVQVQIVDAFIVPSNYV